MAILLNDDELFAMRGLPHAAFCLYVAIRQAMDMATGMVGIRSMISWQALRESLYIEPGPNRQESGSIHLEKVRRLGALLEREGLVKICSNSSNRQLIFKCIKASHDKSVQNKSDRQSDRPQQAAKSIAARVLEFDKRESDRQSDMHPSLEIYSVDNSSSSDRDIPGRAAPDDDDMQSKSENQKQQPESALIFPPRLEEWQREKMRLAMNGIPPDHAQAILDELAGRMRSGTVEKPLGYFQRVMENYLRGDFNGELASGEKAIRERTEREKAERQAEAERRAAAIKSVPVVSMDKIRALREQIGRPQA